MQRVKRRIYSGAVLEQEVYTVERLRQNGTREYRPRFKTEEDRRAHREAISRRRHERLVNENFSPSSIYSTLTFDMDNECHDYGDARKLRDNYVRRLKYRYPDAVIFIYMGRGKHTNRIHLHMLSEGVPMDVLMAQWVYGSVKEADYLREHNYYDGVDHGRDYSALANYLFNHWEPEQGSHRWKATRNARQPEKEEPKTCRRTYTADRPPRTPRGYVLVEVTSNKYGYINYKYVREPGSPPRGKKTEHGNHVLYSLVNV